MLSVNLFKNKQLLFDFFVDVLTSFSLSFIYLVVFTLFMNFIELYLF